MLKSPYPLTNVVDVGLVMYSGEQESQWLDWLKTQDRLMQRIAFATAQQTELQNPDSIRTSIIMPDAPIEAQEVKMRRNDIALLGWRLEDLYEKLCVRAALDLDCDILWEMANEDGGLAQTLNELAVQLEAVNASKYSKAQACAADARAYAKALEGRVLSYVAQCRLNSVLYDSDYLPFTGTHNASHAWQVTQFLTQYLTMNSRPLVSPDVPLTWWMVGLCDLIEREEYVAARRWLTDDQRAPWATDIGALEISNWSAHLQTLHQFVAPLAARAAFAFDPTTITAKPGYARIPALPKKWAGEGILPQRLREYWRLHPDARTASEGVGFSYLLHNLHHSISGQRPQSDSGVLRAWREIYTLMFAVDIEQTPRPFNPALGKSLLLTSQMPETPQEIISRCAWLMHHQDVINVRKGEGVLHLPVMASAAAAFKQWLAEHGDPRPEESSQDEGYTLTVAVNEQVAVVLHLVEDNPELNGRAAALGSLPADGLWDSTWVNWAMMKMFIRREHDSFPDTAFEQAIIQVGQKMCSHADKDLRPYGISPEDFEPSSTGADAIIQTAACACCGNPRAQISLQWTDADLTREGAYREHAHAGYAAARLVYQGHATLADLDQGLDAFRDLHPYLEHEKTSPELARMIDPPQVDDYDFESFTL